MLKLAYIARGTVPTVSETAVGWLMFHELSLLAELKESKEAEAAEAAAAEAAAVEAEAAAEVEAAAALAAAETAAAAAASAAAESSEAFARIARCTRIYHRTVNSGHKNHQW